jgi:hypothetical protein
MSDDAPSPTLSRLGREMAVLVAGSLNPEHGMHYHRGQLTEAALRGLQELVDAGWLRADHRGQVMYWEVIDMAAVKEVAEAQGCHGPSFEVLAAPAVGKRGS